MQPDSLLPRLSEFQGKAINFSSLGDFDFGGKHYQICGFHAVVCRFLRQLVLHLHLTAPHSGRLLPLRTDFRCIAKNPSAVGLLYALFDRDPKLQRLAMWLLGRRGFRLAAPTLEAWPTDAPWEVQFEIARTLQRLHAWEELRRRKEMLAAQWHVDEVAGWRNPHRKYITSSLEWMLHGRLNRMLAQQGPVEYERRLARFLAPGVSAAEPLTPGVRQPVPLWYEAPLGPGRAPKTRWFIRWILERIRTAVREA